MEIVDGDDVFAAQGTARTRLALEALEVAVIGLAVLRRSMSNSLIATSRPSACPPRGKTRPNPPAPSTRTM